MDEQKKSLTTQKFKKNDEEKSQSEEIKDKKMSTIKKTFMLKDQNEYSISILAAKMKKNYNDNLKFSEQGALKKNKYDYLKSKKTFKSFICSVKDIFLII